MSRIDFTVRLDAILTVQVGNCPFGRTFYHDVRPDDRFALFICNDTGHFPVLCHWNGGVARISETDGYRVILSLKNKDWLAG